MINNAEVNEAKAKVAKNFRNAPDIENFYRFIHENGLRREAKTAIEAIMQVIKPKKKGRRKRKAKVLQ